MPYLSALEACSRQGAIQIHIYLYLYLLSLTKSTNWPLAVGVVLAVSRDSGGLMYCDWRDDVVGVLAGVPAVHNLRVGQRQRAARLWEKDRKGGRHRRITSQVTWSPLWRHRVRWFPTASVQQWVIRVTVVRCRCHLRILHHSFSLQPGHYETNNVQCYCLTNYVPCRLLRSFATAGPRIWNSLPADVRSASSLTTFRRKLKTHLFLQSYPNIVI